MPKITFKNPPASRRGRTPSAEWQSIADQLRRRPGKWALVKSGINGGFASHIKAGRIVAFAPAGSFEATWRQSAGPTADKAFPGGDLYVRYVGEGD